MIKLIATDLDGTLLNTLVDLKNAVNSISSESDLTERAVSKAIKNKRKTKNKIRNWNNEIFI